MKILHIIVVVITTLFGAVPAYTDELSEEEYIKEINKAFARFYEATNGKTLSGRIVALEELSLEYKDNQPVLDVLLQERGFAYSLMGKHQQALSAFDQRQRDSESINNAIKDLETPNALSTIVKAVDVNRNFYFGVEPFNKSY